MAFPFLAAQGHGSAPPLCEAEDVELAQDAASPIRRRLEKLELPIDLVVGDRFGADAAVTPLDAVEVPDGLMGLDIGPRTAAAYAERIAAAGTVFWNGPMGAFELEPFAAGTRAVADAVAAAAGDDRRRRRRLGGGGRGVRSRRTRITHVSTGGGASLELIEGRVAARRRGARA